MTKFPLIFVEIAGNAIHRNCFHGKMTDTQKLKSCAIMKFCCNWGMTTKTFEKKSAVKQRKRISRSLVFKWHQQFMDVHYFEKQ
jgi:hypothetical protein